MKFKKFATTTALVTTALSITTGTVNATPTHDTGDIDFTTSVTEKSTIVEIDAGSMAVEDGVFKIKAGNGTVLAGTELKFRVDEFEFPIAAQIQDHTATLTPQFDLQHAVYKPVALPYEDKAPWRNEYEREQVAWARLTSTILTGAQLGAIIGGIGGGAVGCVLGGIAGATVASATIVGLFGAFIPAAAIGCLGGVVALGALGTLAGQLLVAAPIAIMAAVQYFTTINSPMPNQPQPPK
ncbi:hypothetical protein ACQP1G_30110 [Nocardia sp. CA-107356]|uniref:hypothetical protein n=1 Tax=Nocardia sp. CA-107356 TaxID=3239972 RepID=UPI003D8F7F6C